MFASLRRVPPPVYALVSLLFAAVPAVAVLPYVQVHQSPAVAQVPQPSMCELFPGEPECSEPKPCLSDLPPHYYAQQRFSKAQAGPGSPYKESKNAAGPSALPPDWVLPKGMSTRNPTPQLLKELLPHIKREYLFRLCGDVSRGGDKKLFQAGYPALDMAHLARSSQHFSMDPNRPIGRLWWETELEVYLGAIRWDLSHIVYEKPSRPVWTITMVQPPGKGKEPVVKVIRHQQPASYYLMLAVTQPDGVVAYERRRLECGFQTTYYDFEDVPESLRVNL